MDLHPKKLERAVGHGLPNPNQVHQGPLAVSSTALTLATAGVTLHATTSAAMLQVLDANVRVTYDGTNPTATRGFQLQPGDTLLLGREMLQNFRVIREGSTDAALQFQGLL